MERTERYERSDAGSTPAEGTNYCPCSVTDNIAPSEGADSGSIPDKDTNAD